MENKISRPISVWIAQILMILLALLVLLPLLMILLMFTIGGGFPIVMLVVAVMNVGFAALFVAAFLGMARRRQWGRWLSVGLLSLIAFFGILGQIVQPSGPLQRYEYANVTEARAALITQVFIVGLLVWLIYSLAVGKRATAFFTGKEVETTTQIFP